MCGLPAVCREKLPGRRRGARPLCQAHADAVFGADDPPWRRWDAKTRRNIVEEWLRGMTILAHGGGRPAEELLGRDRHSQRHRHRDDQADIATDAGRGPRPAGEHPVGEGGPLSCRRIRAILTSRVEKFVKVRSSTRRER